MEEGFDMEDDDGIPEGLDERRANYLTKVTAKVKSNLLTLTEHHNTDMGILLDSLARRRARRRARRLTGRRRSDDRFADALSP